MNVRPRLRVTVTTLMFVRQNNKVLLHRHPEGSRFAGYWNGIGGHLELGEDLAQAACRELGEEAGVEVKDPRLRLVLHEVSPRAEGNLVFWFVADWLSGGLTPEPCAVLRWVPLREVPSLKLLPDVREVWSWLFKSGPTRYGFQIYDNNNGSELRISDGRLTQSPIGNEG